jgi:hypothetical protein
MPPASGAVQAAAPQVSQFLRLNSLQDLARAAGALR